ncbi:hypothetical protein BASA50_007928 [Batrachochytrium salamandrivorans]|uniref:Oxidoreductase n=1 Tax=Batrachochytrium salamandrivorans TaxID=1357716 RepID=A0ABQ8F5K2_9FUNG|nr:hypothetical protein BASA50_007928 [Batrachochytrium salamandrivorans]KAH6602180.1 hypothetical protein BASA61_001384 [Batrachochytrium salamandrivorans]KAH9247570.1 hypothetical protein BASA81_014826 [Batrachochytrium salamandrivorans]KAJ1332295.1 hypothetical protein BSLG_008601 [Batrachochytrium salamandrivorans]
MTPQTEQDLTTTGSSDLTSVDSKVIPPWESVVTDEDLDAALRIFTVYCAQPRYRAHVQTCPKLRELFDIAKRTLLPISMEDSKINRKRKLAARKEDDRAQLAVTGIRKGRHRKAVGHATGSMDVPLPPRCLKSVEDLESFATENDKNISTINHKADSFSVGHNGLENPPHTADSPQPTMLNFPRACHICPVNFRQLHSFYDQLCPECAEFNYSKRSFSADMRGRVCLVTGARVKIGYCIAIKLLRMGATVIVTTRFPHNAATRYAKESDFQSFKGRLFIYGIDFRDVSMVHQFCRHIKSQFDRLDAIINNAAQTVRKPPLFYEHLIPDEVSSLPSTITSVATIVDVYKKGINNYTFCAVTDAPIGSQNTAEYELALPASGTRQSLSSVNTSAALSQIPLTEEDATANMSLFPGGELDRDDQQVDLRSQNSWTMEIGQISTVEMLECHVINAFAPWVLISELKSLLEATQSRPTIIDQSTLSPASDRDPGSLCDKYIVNVSAMEGQFYRPKTVFHPHSNMAKASLNMMTRTSAAGLAEVNIFMTAVDTGWITDENPIEQWEKRENAPPPLDEWDAAMRVLDPILLGIRGEEKIWGVFLKNYTATRW